MENRKSAQTLMSGERRSRMTTPPNQFDSARWTAPVRRGPSPETTHPTHEQPGLFPAPIAADRQNGDRRDRGDDLVGAHHRPRQVQKPDHGAVGDPCAAAQESCDRPLRLEPRMEHGLRAVHKRAYTGKPSAAVQRLGRIACDRPQCVPHGVDRRRRITETSEGTRL
jgi:hypothetical protein